MIKEYILNPYFQNIIENEVIQTFFISAIIVLLAYSFVLAVSKGVVFVWQKLFLIF